MIDNIIDINYYSFIQSITTVTTKGDLKCLHKTTPRDIQKANYLK